MLRAKCNKRTKNWHLYRHRCLLGEALRFAVMEMEMEMEWPDAQPLQDVGADEFPVIRSRFNPLVRVT